MKNIVFGTGKASEIIEYLFALDIAYYVDNNQGKWGKKFLGKMIQNPENLLTEEKNNLHIYVVSNSYDQIAKQLIDYGFEENLHFSNGLIEINNFTKDVKSSALQKMNFSISKGILSSSLRNKQRSNPETWEFSAFSQNGEDGIIDFLISELLESNRYFIEIGSADGLENTSSYLAIVKNFSGLMIEGSKRLSKISSIVMEDQNLGVECYSRFISLKNLAELKTLSSYLNPDVMVLDIDGNDYYIAQKIFEEGFEPSIFVVEYNSAFGPNDSITIKYNEEFDYKKAHASQLYYGVSIQAWKKLFHEKGYKFIAVDQNGVNAFFVNPKKFSEEFLESIKGIDYKENFYQRKKFKCGWENQFKIIKDLDFERI